MWRSIVLSASWTLAFASCTSTGTCNTDDNSLMQSRAWQAVKDKDKTLRTATNAKDDPKGVLSGGYCDTAGLAEMHGQDLEILAANRSSLQEDLLKDIEQELEDNNVDQDAKEIFTFYVCARWVPDDVFWDVAEQEMSLEILSSVVDKQEKVTQAVGELYQNFKFVPMLCSRNMEVYGEAHEKTKTHFPVFKEQVEELAGWLEAANESQVFEALVSADRIFCDSDKMNSVNCELQMSVKEWLNKHLSWAGADFEVRSDRWEEIQEYFQMFKRRNGSQAGDMIWNTDFDAWKERFPYHSYIAVANGTDERISPTDRQRFMVCFGKRVASEMHRRPGGGHILTDQNNLGCHGWWELPDLAKMLHRTVALWRPPTCQLAELTYTMKREILMMYARLNEELFDALPSMLNDETLSQEELQLALADPEPFNPASLVRDDVTFWDGMRVAAVSDIPKFKADGCRWYKLWLCNKKVKSGEAGTVSITNGKLLVKWDFDKDAKFRDLGMGIVQIVPQEFGTTTGILDKITDATKKSTDAIDKFFKGLHGGQYSKLAQFMSNSFSKWIMCPISEDANLDKLDKMLGTEDVVLQDHIREAYSKWTGYEAKVPGETCVDNTDLLPEGDFPMGCQVCDFNELHVSFPERWYVDPPTYDVEEDFMCPVRPPLPAEEQLQVFMEKKNMCLVHMTANQKQHEAWNYRGDYPARRQYDVKDHAPSVDYQLVKLLNLRKSEGPNQVSYGRSCTASESREHPRFCVAPEFARPWDTVEEMAKDVGNALKGSLGLPVSAIDQTVKNYQHFVKENASGNLTGAEKFGTRLGEQSRDVLFNLGRYAHSLVKKVEAELFFDLAQDELRHARLESELFGFGPGGDFLHSASFQRPMGNNGLTSNARDRFQRYAVVCPCNDFDPAMELSSRWKWTEVALRALSEVHKRAPAVLDKTSSTLQLRSEARLFSRGNEQAKNDTHWKYGAGIKLTGQVGAPSPPVCKTNWWRFWKPCQPSQSCHRKKGKCQLREEELTLIADHNGYAEVADLKLAGFVGGNPADISNIADLSALTITLTCGPKSAYTATGGPQNTGYKSLKECFEKGFLKNADMRAKEPQTLYFPEEVIVVATFGTMEQAHCHTLAGKESQATKLCKDALASPNLDTHISDASKEDRYGGEYVGLRTGADYPKGAVTEVHLRPEDPLQVLGLLLTSE